MSKWYFPVGIDIEKESVNNARIETFTHNIIQSLARETCQNSLDAAISEQKPVIMTFEEKNMDIKEIIDSEYFIDYIIPLAKETWENDDNSQNFLKDYENILKKDKIRILKISDYNTIGLEEKNWISLIEQAGVSYKGSDSSGGSYGIGKAAPFASSDLRMVFYNTMTRDTKEKSIGVCKFISFDIPRDGTTAQGVGYLGREKKLPYTNQLSFNFESRREPGTDLFVIGFNQNKNWKEKIIESLLDNFLVSLYSGLLEVKVGNTWLTKDTMGPIIKSYTKKKTLELRNYYSVLEDLESGKAKVIELDERFKKYGFKEDDGILILSQSKDANRSVLMTRKIGMKIMDRKNISGSIQFNGIFQAKGDKFNSILREMENPNHNDWIPEKYKKNPKKADDLLKDMYRFMKSNVQNEYEEKIDKKVDAFGMAEFLPARVSENDKEVSKESLDEKVDEIKLSNSKNKKSNELRSENSAVEEEDQLEDELRKAGIIEGDTGGKGSRKNTETESSGGTGEDSAGEDEGEYDTGDSDKELVHNAKTKFISADNKILYRIIERNSQKGEYIINITPKDNIKRLKTKIRTIGENGSSYICKLEESIYNNKPLNTRSDYFMLEDLKKDRLYRVNFKINYNQRVKLGVRFDESK